MLRTHSNDCSGAFFSSHQGVGGTNDGKTGTNSGAEGASAVPSKEDDSRDYKKDPCSDWVVDQKEKKFESQEYWSSFLRGQLCSFDAKSSTGNSHAEKAFSVKLSGCTNSIKVRISKSTDVDKNVSYRLEVCSEQHNSGRIVAAESESIDTLLKQQLSTFLQGEAVFKDACEKAEKKKNENDIRCLSIKIFPEKTLGSFEGAKKRKEGDQPKELIPLDSSAASKIWLQEVKTQGGLISLLKRFFSGSNSASPDFLLHLEKCLRTLLQTVDKDSRLAKLLPANSEDSSALNALLASVLAEYEHPDVVRVFCDLAALLPQNDLERLLAAETLVDAMRDFGLTAIGVFGQLLSFMPPERQRSLLAQVNQAGQSFDQYFANHSSQNSEVVAARDAWKSLETRADLVGKIADIRAVLEITSERNVCVARVSWPGEAHYHYVAGTSRPANKPNAANDNSAAQVVNKRVVSGAGPQRQPAKKSANDERLAVEKFARTCRESLELVPPRVASGEFTTIAVEGHDRISDSEVTVLEELREQLYTYGKRLEEQSSSDAEFASAIIKIDLLTERPPCASCTGVITQFRERYRDRFPKLELNVLDNFGRTVPVSFSTILLS